MKNIFCILFLFASVALVAQQEKPFLTLQLKNGDVLTGITDISTISFKTSYGDLAFPIKEVAQLTLGVSRDGIDKKDVFDQCDRLQNYSLTEAAVAFDKLLKMEAGALPIVREYIESPAYKKREGDLTVDLAYEVMLSRHRLKKSYSTKDLLQSVGATAVEGTYLFESLVIESDYGRISVARSKIASISISTKEVNVTNSGTFKLQANQNISGNTASGWLNTGILAKQGQQVKINASGQINLASISNNAYTPDGGVNGSPGAKGNELSYGSLVFKIGESGAAIKAGDNFQGNAAATGIVYLAIYESVFNVANSGTYVAKVLVR